MQGGRCREQLAWRDLPQPLQPARSILGTHGWPGGVGQDKENKENSPCSGVPQHGASGGPTVLPTLAQPHSHPGSAGTSTQGMLGWHSLVKPAGAECQSRV